MLADQESEMLGIMFGDGSLSQVGGSIQIAITGNKADDKDYLLNYVHPLFTRLFGINLRTRCRQGEETMDLYTYSKRVALKLNQWGMPISTKNSGELRPKVSLKERSFIRGIFDTDGCVYCKYGKYAQIQFKNSSATLMEYIAECLKKLGFHPTRLQENNARYKFYLCKQAEVDRFFNIIAPANIKHIKRLNVICGHVPPGIRTGSRTQ